MNNRTRIVWFVLLPCLLAPHFAYAHQTFAFKLSDNLVAIPATVNGKQVSAVLDSGTGGVIINRAVAGQFGIAVEAPSGAAVGGGGGAQDLFPVSFASIAVGNSRLGNVKGFALDLSPLSTSAKTPIDLLIGSPIFNGGVVSVDYRSSTVVFSSQGELTSCANPIPIDLSHGVPVVEVNLRTGGDTAPVKLHLIVDLGTRHFAAMIGGPFLNTQAGQSLLLRGSRQKIGTGTGGEVSGSVVQVNGLAVGDQELGSPEIALTSEVKAFDLGFADGTLGVPFWKMGSIAFDYPGRRICLSGQD